MMLPKMMLQGVSRQAAGASVDELDRVLDRAGESPATVGDELFAVTALVDAEPTLRRTISDPSRTADERAALLDALLDGKVSSTTREVVQTVVRQRWTRPRDLSDTLESLGVRATVAAVDSARELDTVEDELFRFRQIVVANAELRAALADVTGPAERRASLLDSLLDGKVTATSRRLVDQAVTRPRGRTIENALDAISKVVADRRERLVAHVRAARDLSDEQRDRLVAALTRMYGHEVALNIEIDETVVGGLSVRVGAEVVDATIAGRLDEARRRLVG